MGTCGNHESTGTEAGEVKPTFSYKDGKIEIILNENADQYLHVHPKDESKPVFETQFDHPGIYKI